MSAIYKIEADERRPSRQIAELLVTQLEIPPDQRALFLKVAQQEKAVSNLDAITPIYGYTPAPTPKKRQSSLPIYPNPFVGRDHEIDIVVKQLLNPACRLLTLTGPGGVGKTRLAVEVARKLETAYANGVVFLPMAGVNLPESIIPAVADAFGLVFSGPADPKQQLIQELRNQEILLLLDNMEHLIEGTRMLGEILQQAPGIKLLLTSREQVHLQWEWIFDVQGLPIPGDASSSTLETNSAITLLLQRASQSSHDFSLDPEEASSLVRICKLVDGFPLAIELAASWIRTISFSEIAQELEQGFDLLESTMQDVPDRHRSIKVVFDHSWKLLTAEERAGLMKLAVFQGGFTRRAAEAVAGASLLMLSSLVGKSLLRHNKKTDRYDFHELIHQYANAKLHDQPGEEMVALEKHSQYFSHWIASREAAIKSELQIEASAQIRAETANWISAWQWAVQHHQLSLLRAMSPCLYWYFEIHGYYAEALSTYKMTLESLRAAGAPGSLSTPEERTTYAFLLNQIGWFEFRMGNLELAVTLFAESLERSQDLLESDQRDDQEVLYHTHVNWGYLTLVNNDPLKAKQMTEASLANAKKMNSPWHIAIAETILGIVEYQRGNVSESHRQLTSSLTFWRTVGDPRGLVFCMLYLSTAALALGDLSHAEAILQESNTIAADKMDRWAQAFGLELLGQIAMAQGLPEKARGFFQQSLSLSQEIGDKWASTQTLIHLAETQAALEFNSHTKSLFVDAYQIAIQAKWTPTVIEVLMAYISLDPEISPEIKLAVAQSILSHPTATPPVRQRAEQLYEKLNPSQNSRQDSIVQADTQEKSPEKWAHEVFSIV